MAQLEGPPPSRRLLDSPDPIDSREFMRAMTGDLLRGRLTINFVDAEESAAEDLEKIRELDLENDDIAQLALYSTQLALEHMKRNDFASIDAHLLLAERLLDIINEGEGMYYVVSPLKSLHLAALEEMDTQADRLKGEVSPTDVGFTAGEEADMKCATIHARIARVRAIIEGDCLQN